MILFLLFSLLAESNNSKHLNCMEKVLQDIGWEDARTPPPHNDDCNWCLQVMASAKCDMHRQNWKLARKYLFIDEKEKNK